MEQSIEISHLLEDVLDIYCLDKISNKKPYKTSLEHFEAKLSARELSDSDIKEVCGLAAMHPDPWVRSTCLKKLIAAAPENSDVLEVVSFLTHDFEDIVFFPAIRACGDLVLSNSVSDLALLSDFSEVAADRPNKPVGIGHAAVFDSVSKILETSDPEILKAKMHELFPDGRDKISSFKKEPTVLPLNILHSHDNMIYIPPGTVEIGKFPSSIRNRLLKWDERGEERIVETKGFWIDKFPTSCAEYDKFAFSEAAKTHKHCHSGEAKNHLHIRNTLLDERFKPGDPVTGISWSDGFSFARSMGKRLPLEEEWQRAAEGDEKYEFPWGNEFRADKVHGIHKLSKTIPSSAKDWRRELLKLLNEKPNDLVVPVKEELNVSPFGVVGMAGNQWEWTSTNRSSLGHLNPSCCSNKSYVDLIYDYRSFSVLKGGTWTSIPEMMSTKFRGNDFIYDRHFEIGMRCVCDCPPPNDFN
ncbi:MAG: formylglycine-generating enzyme family protein [Proteobacteria bacterium]|nr:formylglycine-generating enzyme family protein [Pseudomonadota bacterium]